MSEKIEEVMVKFGITNLRYTDPNDDYDCNFYNAFETDGRVMIIENEDGCGVKVSGATWVLAWKDYSDKATLFTSIIKEHALEEKLLKSNAVNTFLKPLRERIKKLERSINCYSWNKTPARVSNYEDFHNYFSIFLDCTTGDHFACETRESIEKFIEEAKGECSAIVEFDPIHGQVFLCLVSKYEKKMKTHRASYI